MNHSPHFSELGDAYWIGFAVMLVVMVPVLLLLRLTARGAVGELGNDHSSG